MKKSNFALRLQQSLMEEAKKVAKAEGVAVNQLINVAVAEKVSALRTEEYFAERAARGDVKNALQVLRRAGKGKPPIPGDEIAGYVTTGEGVKIHLKTCKNYLAASAADPRRVVEVGWPLMNGTEFAAAIKISGEDRTGLLNDITHSISTYQNTNIRGVKIDTKDSLFEGTILVNVKNTDHLSRIIEKLRKVKGVSKTERLME